MKTLRGMAEHRFSNVYSYQCLMWILTFPLIPISSYLLFIFQKTRCMNCNLLENKNGKFLIGARGAMPKNKQHFRQKVNNNKGSLGHLYKCKLVY